MMSVLDRFRLAGKRLFITRMATEVEVECEIVLIPLADAASFAGWVDFSTIPATSQVPDGPKARMTYKLSSCG